MWFSVIRLAGQQPLENRFLAVRDRGDAPTGFSDAGV